jgi:hypothetical protein
VPRRRARVDAAPATRDPPRSARSHAGAAIAKGRAGGARSAAAPAVRGIGEDVDARAAADLTALRAAAASVDAGSASGAACAARPAVAHIAREVHTRGRAVDEPRAACLGAGAIAHRRAAAAGDSARPAVERMRREGHALSRADRLRRHAVERRIDRAAVETREVEHDRTVARDDDAEDQDTGTGAGVESHTLQYHGDPRSRHASRRAAVKVL